MSFLWLKRYMPRSLYARAALILVLPVVFLQLVVSVVFIQRHFEDVTTQMTLTVSRQLELMFQQIDGSTSQADALASTQALADTLVMSVAFPDVADVPRQDSRRWYDLSGRVIISTLAQQLPRISPVLLPDDRIVHVVSETQVGIVQITFQRRRVSASNPHQLLVNMIFFGGLMTVIAYIYLRNQLRPIKRLARAAEAFGRGRHEPYSPGGAIEVRAAGSAFLDMRARIERQIEQRTLMLSGISHDLRTPLTRMKLSLSMLDDEDRAPLEQDVEDMLRLVDEFLSFAKGSAEGEMEEVDPKALIEQIVEDCKRAGLPVTLHHTEGEGTVMLRRLAIRRAIENLVNNAVRYGATAEVSMTLTDKSLRFRVEDDGPGIPAEHRAEAIKPFSRLDPARNQNKGASVGLGLAIATDIARAHGGVLRLSESERLGGLRADIVIAR